MTSTDRETDAGYTVYVDPPADADVSSPLSVDRIEYYDTGVWMESSGTRRFFPWARVEMITESVEAETEPAESPADSDDEPTESPADSDDETAEPDAAETGDGGGDDDHPATERFEDEAPLTSEQDLE